MVSEKKVLFVISTLNTGGAQRAFANMSLGFPDGWQCDFLLNDDSEPVYPYRGNIISLHMKPREDKTGLTYQLRVFRKRYAALRKLKKNGNYTACISALTSANAVNVLTGNRYCKTVASIRIFMSKSVIGTPGYKSAVKFWLVRHLSNRSDYVVAVSESIRNDLIQNFAVKPEKAVTIYNGYPVADIRRLAEEPLSGQERAWFQKKGPYVATCGRLDKQKGQAHLIRAFQKVMEKLPGAVLLIMGEGGLRAELEALIHSLGLDDSVILCGFVKNPYKILKRCSLFVLPSLYEGFPNTLAESLCLGVPAVSSDFDSGAREILSPDTDLSEKVTEGYEKAQYGILCPVCGGALARDQGEALSAEERAMAEAMLLLLQDASLYAYYQKQCGLRAEQLSIEQSVRQWIERVL